MADDALLTDPSLAGLPDILKRLRSPGLSMPSGSVPVSMPDPNAPQYQPLHGWRGLAANLAQLSPEAGIRGIGTNALKAPQERLQNDLKVSQAGLQMQDTAAQMRQRQAEADRAEAAANKPEKPQFHEVPPGGQLVDETGKVIASQAAKPELHEVAPGGELVDATGKVIASQPAKPEKPTEAETPLSDAQVQQFNAGLSARYQANNPGKQAPTEFQLGKGATQKDFDHIDKLLTGTETASATAAARAQTESNEEQNRTTKARDDRDKFVQPFKQAVDTTTDANSYVNSGKPTGPGDYALMNEFQEMIVNGQKAGIRFTQNEQSMLRNAQSWIDSLKAHAKHALSGSYFSDNQRKEILDVMNGISKRAQKQIDDYDTERGAKGKGALTADDARAYLEKAGGDKDKARQLAKADGRTF